MAPSAAAGLPHTPTLFGDQLALARRSWVRRMAGVAAAVLLRGPTPVGRLVDVLGATRQAARKIVEGLERRGYVTTERDATDARRLIVSLTPAGEGYARAVVGVIEALNQEIAVRVPPDDLAAARRVLFEVMSGDERVRRLEPARTYPRTRRDPG